jgi:hypothetical protein
MKPVLYIESFSTIYECANYLTQRMGIKWDADKERELANKMSYKCNNTLVLYDPAQILSNY